MVNRRSPSIFEYLSCIVSIFILYSLFLNISSSNSLFKARISSYLIFLYSSIYDLSLFNYSSFIFKLSLSFWTTILTSAKRQLFLSSLIAAAFVSSINSACFSFKISFYANKSFFYWIYLVNSLSRTIISSLNWVFIVLISSLNAWFNWKS